MESKHIKGIYRLGHNNKNAVVCESGYKIIPICQCLIGMKDENEETAEANAAYIVKCVNAHEELKNCLQAFVYQIETYNLKHEFPGAYMDAKNALQKINEKE